MCTHHEQCFLCVHTHVYTQTQTHPCTPHMCTYMHAHMVMDICISALHTHLVCTHGEHTAREYKHKLHADLVCHACVSAPACGWMRKEWPLPLQVPRTHLQPDKGHAVLFLGPGRDEVLPVNFQLGQMETHSGLGLAARLPESGSRALTVQGTPAQSLRPTACPCAPGSCPSSGPVLTAPEPHPVTARVSPTVSLGTLSAACDRDPEELAVPVGEPTVPGGGVGTAWCSDDRGQGSSSASPTPPGEWLPWAGAHTEQLESASAALTCLIPTRPVWSQVTAGAGSGHVASREGGPPAPPPTLPSLPCPRSSAPWGPCSLPGHAGSQSVT